MAFNFGERFTPPQKSYRLLDPGAYQSAGDHKLLLNNKIPFLSRTPRNTQCGGRLWTHAIYNTVVPCKIPNITCIISKTPRFHYESFSKEDLEGLLCRCGIQNPCECTKYGDENTQDICQGKIHRRIFKGTGLKNAMQGLLAPSDRDHCFETFPKGSQKRLFNKLTNKSPPFYDVTLYESAAFYHGCRWSKRTSKRSPKALEEGPGPGHYSFEKHLTDFEKSAEKFRFTRRQSSKQLRYIESIQEKNFIEASPGPTSYSPMHPKGFTVQSFGSKAKRFPVSLLEQYPGPADHTIKREFDQPKPPNKSCHTKLPEPPFFGIKAQRFKPRCEEGPSPASYNINITSCRTTHCSAGPFGSSSVRFKETLRDEGETTIAEDESQIQKTKHYPSPSWGFKSKTIRIKPLKKDMNSPSPADLSQSCAKHYRVQRLQYVAPFFSSEGRFQPWYDWMPVMKSHDPCYYCLEKPKCYPVVKCGPFNKAPRFLKRNIHNPSPNKYKPGGGIETILATYNKKLKDNIKKKHKFVWIPSVQTPKLSYKEREQMLLLKSITLLNTDNDDRNSKSSITSLKSDRVKKSKLLRCFIHGSKTN